MASIILGSVSMPSLETMYPKYASLVLKNSCFFSFNFRSAWANFSNTPLRHSRCFFGVFEKIITSSKKMMHQFKWRSPRTCLHQSLRHSWSFCKSKWYPSTLIEPKGPTVNAVYCLLSSSISTCQ